MVAKVQESENKRASKARIREGVRGQWWPCETTDAELRELQNEGMISEYWSFMRDSDVPKPEPDERVMTKAWVERGLSLPCSEFFFSILDTYGLQPHNICLNSYLLLSKFATLCEGHLGIRPSVTLWQFFFRVKKETKDKAMLNCGSMTFMLRSGRMYPPHDSHESVLYWNAGWFYVKNSSVPNVHDGLPAFNNNPPEELTSWSFIPSLAQTPILEKAARRISWLVHDGLTGAQLTLSWFSRRIQPLRYNARLMCAYTGADDLLRVTRQNLPADSLKRRFKTLVKIGRGQPISELIKDIYTQDQCPSLDSMAEENLRNILRVPVSGESAEEDPEDPEEEEERVPRKAAPRPSKCPRAKASGSEAGASGEASAKKPKVTKPPPLNSKKAERERLKLLNPTPTTARNNVQEPITKFMHKKSPAVGPSTPAPPSAPPATPQPSPPPADQSPAPDAPTPPEIIPVSSDRAGGESSGGKGPVQDKSEGQGREDVEVNSSGKAEAATGDMVVFPKNFGDPADLTSVPKAYATKFFNKLTEAEKWELEQDLPNSMLNNAWGKPYVETSEIQEFKKDVGLFFDKLVCKQKEQKALHYELHKNIALQRRVTISQAESIQHFQTENAELKKQLSEAKGASSSLAAASSELETLRASQKTLETKLAEAEKKLAEKNSELIQKEGEFQLKRNTDSNTIKKQQKELGGLRKYMETAEASWDWLISGVLARGAAAMSLAMCLGHNPDMDVDRVTTGVPADADVGALLDAVSGYDTRIARRIRHNEFYDKVVLPADEPLEAELLKEREAEAKPAQSESQYTWTSSKDQGGTGTPATDEEEDDDDVSSPAKDEEADAPATEVDAETSPAKEK
ncbi:hypothetical protein QYE76_065172 [Lolium multiflorum]|uniref:Transposase (putative) gypsy type domain-containing protein n=1 Tax=Lolium multiflorum TaxID=4521 RepID=A0AAD8SAI5_LOLMU|nr:hypothetical protein QYE76_065172 [Lolium multiflorum]